jgi:hypothetical protein
MVNKTTIVAILAKPNFIPGIVKKNTEIDDSTMLRTILMEIINDKKIIFLVPKFIS